MPGAIADFAAAAGFHVEDLGGFPMAPELREFVLERGRKRQAAGDEAGAERDFAALARDAHRPRR